MWHTEKNPLRKVTATSESVTIVRGARQRKLHKAFLRYHDANNWPLLRDALKQMGRADLIGNGKKHLVPGWQPAETPGAKATRATRSKSPSIKPYKTGLAKPTRRAA